LDNDKQWRMCLSCYTFHPRSEKPIKEVICHLPTNALAKDMADGPVDNGFDVISLRQMSTAHRSPEGSTSINLPLFL
jgi:hypothetical protein